jgi:hypothetical protein
MDCCICLDPAKEDDPLYLLSCGCKVALFHQTCETKWTDTLPIDTPIKCLICKREPILKLNYCFTDIGPSQKFLLNTAILFSLEIPLAFYYNTWVIGAQGLYIILYPFVAPFQYDLTYFLAQYNFTMIINLLLILLYRFNLKVESITTYRFIHIGLLSLFINARKKVNPLTPFVITREITHSKM